MTQPPKLDQYATTPIFNTKAVVRETDVPADTFRAWERRYGVPRPHRTDGGHRLYSERDIAVIRWLRDQTAESMNISQAVRMLQTFDDSGSALVVSVAAVQTEPRAFQLLQQELLAAMVSFNAARAEQLLSEAFALYLFEDVLLRLIQPLMVDVGERWHRGEINIAVEHFTSQFVRRKLSGLLSASEQSASRGNIIVACAPDEQHDLGPMLVALFLMRRGWHVVYLGPQLPKEDLLDAVRIIQPDLVCLAASMPFTARQLAEVAQTLRGASPATRVGYGGRIFNLHPELREAMHGTYLGQDAREVVATVAALLAATSVAPR